MRAWRAVFAVAAIWAAVGIAAGAPAFDKVVPEDTLAFVSVKNVPEMAAKVRKHPSYAIWKEPSVQAFLQKPLARLNEEIQKAEGEAGVTLAEIWSLLQGQVAVSVSMPAQGDEPEVIVMADVSGKGDQAMKTLDLLWKSMAARAPAAGQAKVVELEIEGSKFISIRSDAEAVEPDVTYGIAGDVLVGGRPLAAVQRAVSFLKAPPPAPLAALPAYQQALDKVGSNSEIAVFVNVAKIIQLVDQRAGDPQTTQIMNGLGLNGLSTLSIGGEMANDHMTSRVSLMTTGNPQGIVRILMPQPGALHSGAEAPADASAFLSCRFEPALIWDEVEKILNTVAPQVLAAMNAGLAQVAQQTEQPFNLRSDILGVFGPRLAMYTRFEKPYKIQTSQQMVFILDISSRQAFESALEKLKKLSPLFNMFQPQDYMGYRLYTMGSMMQEMAPPPEMAEQPRPAFAITEKEFIFSPNKAALEAHLRRLNAGAPSLQTRRDFQENLAALPAEGRILISFSDPRPQVEFLLSTLKEGQYQPVLDMLKGDPDTAEVLDLFDLALLPPPEVVTRHLSTGAGCILAQPDGLLILSHSPAKPAE